MNKLLKALKNDGHGASNVALTQNGAVSNKSTLDKVLDLFANGGAYRLKSDNEFLNLFKAAYLEDPSLTLKCIFYFRDVRGGDGQRKIFRTAMKWLANENPLLVKLNLDNFAFYGRFDDLYTLIGTPVQDEMLEYVKNQLNADLANLQADKSVSLLGKWLASENTSSADTRSIGSLIRNYLGLSSRDYRKMLSQLRAYIGIVETKLCQKSWAEIDYNIIPSRAAMLYRDAFKKHDGLRYAKWQNDVKTGKKGAKVNAGTLYPYDLVSRVLSGGDIATLDLQWKALPNYLKNTEDSFICLVDTSGSMNTSAAGPGVSAMTVAVSLGLYCAERAKGPFKDHFITFSARPTLQKIEGSSLFNKVQNLSRAAWDMNTDLEAAFDLILNTAIRHKLSQSDLPSNLLVISDMEFDACMRNSSLTNYENAKRKFAQAGYKLPRVVFWKVSALSNQTPVVKNDRNTALISGFGTGILQYLFNVDIKTPLDQMREVLNSPRYSRVITESGISNAQVEKTTKVKSVNLKPLKVETPKNDLNSIIEKTVKDAVAKALKGKKIVDAQKRDQSTGRFVK